DWTVLFDDPQEEFVGFDQLSTSVKITRYRKVKAKGKEHFQLVFNLTPFYPNGGGQVGDQGTIEVNGNSVRIFDTVKENNLIIHKATKLPEDLQATFQAQVDIEKRSSTQLNHTATHLLHFALRSVLGDHVEQKGSLVHPEYLRFDFSHFSKMTDEELELVEQSVNDMIRANQGLNEHRNMPISEAKAAGAMMLFGEKYGDVVRMIEFGDSKELCGGTHVQATGEIGLFKITGESAIAAGIRRIEALTGRAAYDYVNGFIEEMNTIKQKLKNPQDVQKAVSDLLEQQSAMQKELDQFKKEKAGNLKGELLGKVQTVNGVQMLAEIVDLGPAQVKDLAFQLKNELPDLFAVLGSKNGDKALLTCVVAESLVKEKGLHAGDVVRELAKEIKGGGGGQPFFATAGGKDPNGLEAAIKKAANFVS
ncbi:MAG: alanine--tRNA ligase, partial [Flavobacteriales bacterium]|nr:alanine--tRNA ligase [Flavobacteriales bacterium]